MCCCLGFGFCCPGICPIREELYAQCFDELIRQVTINCAERGLLLLRVRDEIRMTIACYQTLYDSSIAFGMRKALQSEQNKIDMQVRGHRPCPLWRSACGSLSLLDAVHIV